MNEFGPEAKTVTETELLDAADEAVWMQVRNYVNDDNLQKRLDLIKEHYDDLDPATYEKALTSIILTNCLKNRECRLMIYTYMIKNDSFMEEVENGGLIDWLETNLTFEIGDNYDAVVPIMQNTLSNLM